MNPVCDPHAQPHPQGVPQVPPQPQQVPFLRPVFVVAVTAHFLQSADFGFQKILVTPSAVHVELHVSQLAKATAADG